MQLTERSSILSGVVPTSRSHPMAHDDTFFVPAFVGFIDPTEEETYIVDKRDGFAIRVTKGHDPHTVCAALNRVYRQTVR